MFVETKYLWIVWSILIQRLNILAAKIGVILFELLHYLVVGYGGYLIRIRLYLIVERLLLNAVILRLSEISADFAQPLLDHILLLPYAEDCILTFVLYERAL